MSLAQPPAAIARRREGASRQGKNLAHIARTGVVARRVANPAALQDVWPVPSPQRPRDRGVARHVDLVARARNRASA